MRPIVRLVSIVSMCAVASTAIAETIDPGKEGELAKFIPPEPGARICYARKYDAEHLKAHPKQRVTEIQFRLAYYRHDPEKNFPQGQRNYYFALLAKLKGQKRMLTSMGECSPKDGQIVCQVDCDGGGVTVRRRDGDKVLVSLDRIRMSLSCDDDEQNAVELTGGADDREFLLTKTGDAACPDYDRW